MIIAHTIGETRDAVAQARKQGKSVGLVPTMGALHEGHFSLVQRCREECGFVIVSIFVNPTQFGPAEDLDGYPRTLETDCSGCRELGTDLVFAPTTHEMYPLENRTWVNVEQLTEHLCGASRANHFRGVCTVVAKLFNIVTPDRAYFGQKDGQQLAVIRRMAADLNMPIDIVGCPTVRQADGLALSSRNNYLDEDHRRRATCLYRALEHAQELILSGKKESANVTHAMRLIIEQQNPDAIDYISIVDNDLLQPVSVIDRPVMIALAVTFGRARLIDNIVVDPSP